MKHKWHIVKLRHQDGLRCSTCGQEWPDSEMELFKQIHTMPCPNYIGRNGDFVIEFRRWKAMQWTPHTHCMNIRQAIEFCRHRFEDCDLQLYDRIARAEITEF